MSQAISPVSGKPYGLAGACRVWRLAGPASTATNPRRLPNHRDGAGLWARCPIRR